MAHIVISSRGTLGDYVPFVALGRRLQARGHRVVLAFNPAVIDMATRAGLEGFPCGKPLGPSEARRMADGWDHWKPLPEAIYQQRLPLLDFSADYRDLIEACRGADLLITSCFQEAGPLVHEATRIPWASVAPTPMLFRHAGDPPPARGVTAGWHQFYEYQNEVRHRLGFRRLPHREWESSCLSEQLALLASSRHFSRPLRDRYPRLRLTGFWSDVGAARTYQPAPALREFLGNEPAPLLLTYSGLPVVDPQRVLREHAEAALLLGRRLLVQSGWADFQPGMLPARLRRATYFAREFIPHGWLLPRVAAVMHHAGLGTTASALRAACPMVAEPYGNDQFLVAARIRQLGVGVALHPHRLTGGELARVLQKQVLTPKCQRRLAVLARRLHQEDGLELACGLLERKFKLKFRRRRMVRVNQGV